MNTRMELGRIAGIPVYLDMMFVLVLILFSHRYFTSGDSQLMSAGLVIIAGIFLSVFLHELGHAFAARAVGSGVEHIELTGMGGVTHFQRSLPRSVLARTFVHLAGPAANLALWLGFAEAARTTLAMSNPMFGLVLASLAGVNMVLLIFNLLPAYPLDGGHTLDGWLGALFGHVWSVRIVSVLGLIVTAGLVYLALPTNFWMLLIAFFIGQTNWEALQSVGGFPGGGGGRRR